MIYSDEYFKYSLAFNPKEIELCKSITEWLPDEIIDAHTHSALPEHVIMPLDPEISGHMMSTFPSFSLEQSLEMQRMFFPGKTVRTLRFALPFKGIKHKMVNQYLFENSAGDDRVALCGVPTDIDYTVKMMREKNVAGLKMYDFFFNPKAKEIYEFFKPEILEEAQAIGVPIILHLPQIITQCKKDLWKLIKDFPRLTIVLCHLGLPELPVPGLSEAYQEFASHSRLFMDTALIPSEEVVGLAIQYFGIERIMFGSDAPLNMVRAKVYRNPNLGERLITEYPYHWVDQKEHDEYKHLAKGAIHIHWQALLALKAVIEKLASESQDKAKKLIFNETAKIVYGF